MRRTVLALLAAAPISLALQLPTPPAQAKGCQAPLQGRYAVMAMGTVANKAGTNPEARLLEERWLPGGAVEGRIVERLGRSAPLLVVVSARSDAARGRLAPLRDGAVRRIVLAPLGRDAVAALVTRAVGPGRAAQALTERLYRETEGNVLFLVLFLQNLLLAGMLVYVIEARLLAAAACAAIAAVLSWFGVIHAWQFSQADTVLQVGWGVGSRWALGYGLMALMLALSHLAIRRPPGHQP